MGQETDAGPVVYSAALRSAVAVVLGLQLVACSRQSSKPADSSPTNNDDFISIGAIVASPSSLPKCVSKLYGTTAYVQTPVGLYTCQASTWLPVPCTALLAGAVAYSSASQTLLACSSGQWTPVLLPTGPQGPSGMQGVPGPAGPMGAPGAIGQMGTAGPQGSMGTSGMSGFSSLIAITSLAEGSSECPTGGEEIQVGLDVNANGVLDASEVTNTAFICNGVGSSSIGDAAVDMIDAGTDINSSGSPGVDGGADTQSDSNSDASVEPFVLMLACSSAQITGASFDGTTWTPGFPAGIKDCNGGGVGLAVTSAGEGVGVLSGGSEDLEYVTWAGGTWSGPMQVGSASLSMGQPAVVSIGNGVATAFLSPTFSISYSVFASASWSPVLPPVGGSNPAISPLGPALASVDGVPTVAYVDGVHGNMLGTSDLRDGNWTPVTYLSQSGPNSLQMVALNSGPELLLVGSKNASGQMFAFTRTDGVWSGEMDIPDLLASQFAILALANGQALVVAVGYDGNLYAATYSAGSTWTTPSLLPFGIPVSGGSPAVSLSPGAFGDTAELAFLEDQQRAGPALGGLFHARYRDGSWSNAVRVGTEGNVGVAIATFFRP